MGSLGNLNPLLPRVHYGLGLPSLCPLALDDLFAPRFAICPIQENRVELILLSLERIVSLTNPLLTASNPFLTHT